MIEDGTHRQTDGQDLDGGAQDLEHEKNGKVGVLQSAVVVDVQLLQPFDAELALKIRACFYFTQSSYFFYIHYNIIHELSAIRV